MQRIYDEIAGRGAEVLAVSMDNLSGAESLARRVGIDFPVLYTSNDSAVPRAYNVFNRLNDGLATPSVFIIDADGRIVWQKVGRSKTDRVSGSTVLRNLP